MDPTALPTDNLYKFLALAGALLLGIVWLGITRKMDRLIERKTQLAVEEAKLELAVKHLAADGAAKDKAEFDERMRMSRELALKHAELAKLTEAYKFFEKSGESLATKTVFIIAGLFALMLTGFVLWYTRVQVHQDQQVIDAKREQKAKADLAELELQKATAGDKKQ